jgi:hypothetical protein
VIAKLVEVAFVVVALIPVTFPNVAPPTALSWPAMVEDEVTERSVVDAEMVEISAKRDVDEAKIPLCAKIGVEVADVLVPKFSVGVNGNDAWLGVA